MYRREPLNFIRALQSNSVGVPYKPDFPIEREASNREDFADLYYDVANKKQLHFPEKESDLDIVKVPRVTYLRPTAACFFSDLNIRKMVTSMAMPQRIMDPEGFSTAQYPIELSTYPSSLDVGCYSEVFLSRRNPQSRTLLASLTR